MAGAGLTAGIDVSVDVGVGSGEGVIDGVSDTAAIVAVDDGVTPGSAMFVNSVAFADVGADVSDAVIVSVGVAGCRML